MMNKTFLNMMEDLGFDVELHYAEREMIQICDDFIILYNGVGLLMEVRIWIMTHANF